MASFVQPLTKHLLFWSLCIDPLSRTRMRKRAGMIDTQRTEQLQKWLTNSKGFDKAVLDKFIGEFCFSPFTTPQQFHQIYRTRNHGQHPPWIRYQNAQDRDWGNGIGEAPPHRKFITDLRQSSTVSSSSSSITKTPRPPSSGGLPPCLL